MHIKGSTWRMVLAALLIGASAGSSKEARSSDERLGQFQEVFLFTGSCTEARMVMRWVYRRSGEDRVCVVTMLRKELRKGYQKFSIYFQASPKMRDPNLVWKHPAHLGDRCLLVPDRGKAPSVATDSRMGLALEDFIRENIPGRGPRGDMAGGETLAGRICYVLERAPRPEKESWIVLLREEYYDRQQKFYRVFRADEMEKVVDFPAETQWTIQDLDGTLRRVGTFKFIELRLGFSEALFSDIYLRDPPPEWIR